MRNRRSTLGVALLAIGLLSVPTLAGQREWTMTGSAETIYEDLDGDKVEVTLSVDKMSPSQATVTLMVYVKGKAKPKEFKWTSDCLGKSSIYAACITKVTVGTDYSSGSASGTIDIVYRRACDESCGKTGMVPGQTDEGISLAALAGDQVLVNVTQWVTLEQASALLGCLRFDAPGCPSDLAERLLGFTFTFDLFSWCWPGGATSSLALLDHDGNEVVGCASGDTVFVQLTDVDHTGSGLLSRAVVIAGLKIDLLAMPGRPGVFVSPAISLVDLALAPGELLHAFYTDPANPLDTVSVTFSLCRD